MMSREKTTSSPTLGRIYQHVARLPQGGGLLPQHDQHPPLEKRITLTMPAWMVGELDEEAADLAISRNAVVNTWIADRLRTTRRRETIHA